MAESKKTRIILRNDSTNAWTAVAESAVLYKGEIGIEFDPSADAAHKVRMKIGDGKTAWGALDYFGESAEQRFAKTYQVDVAAGADKVAAITAAVGSDELKAGDIAIVREAIHGDDKKQYTAFVYSGAAWTAMDGNYNAENVYFAEDLTYTSNIGVLTVPPSGNATLAAAGKNVKEVLSSILAKAQDPAVTQPSVSITLTGAGAKEVGTEYTPSYNVTFNKGNYQYGPDTGITATYAVSDTSSHTATTATGSFEAFTVGDATNYKVNVTATHTEGAIPKNNLGSEVPNKKINAGTKSAGSGAVTGFRNSFWGGVKSKEGTPTNAIIRGLAGKRGSAIAVNYVGDAQESVGDMRVIIAVPAPRTITSIKDTNGLNAEAFSAFTHVTVNVEGLNGYEAKSYNVYYKDNADACNKANKWHFTVG